MAIKYQSQERVEPGVEGGGRRRYYARIVTDGEVTIDDIVKDIEKFSALSEPDIRGVIIALENVIQDKLADSKIIRLEKLGTLYPSLSSEGRDKEEDVDANCIKKVGVNYRPGPRILKAMQTAGFKKVSKDKK